MIGISIVMLAVVASGLYWLGKLMPSATMPLWRGASVALAACHAPVPLRRAVADRIDGSRGGGCGGCRGCSKGGGCS